MTTKPLTSLRYFLQYLPVAALLGLARLLPFDARGKLAGAVGAWAVRVLPPFRRRVEEGLTRVYPDMPSAERRQIAAEVGRNTGRTLTEILFNGQFAKCTNRFTATGPGLEVLKNAKEAGTGAIIISAHFGQWEAIRHYLKQNGMESGAIYRINSNPWYEPHFLNGILKGGAPIVPNTRGGTLDMVRHIRKGGFFSILADQYVQFAPSIPFLGHDTATTTSPAELALKYNVPLVPAFGLRGKNGRDIAITIQTPIDPSDPETMMADYNARVADQIHQNPGQWYWLHRRWKQI